MSDPAREVAASLAREADNRRQELIQQRQIPADLFRRAGEAKLFRQMVPVALGGLGLAAVDWFLNGLEMARWEPSFSWVVTQGGADMATYLAAGSPAFAEAFLADPCAYSASSDNVSGTLIAEGDGYRVEGRWGFCSGCQGSTWLGGFCEPPEGGDGRWVLVPADRAEIVETWDTMGMIGTGSHTVVLKPQHVPADWTFVVVKPGTEDYGPMSAAAGNGYWPIATSTAAVQLGIARRALDEGVALIKRKLDIRGAAPLAENAHVQRQMMKAEAAWASARAGVVLALQDLWQEAAQAQQVPRGTLLRLVRANIHAAASATEIVQAVCDQIGTSVAPARSIFGACLRDARTIGSHISVNPAKYETLARLSFGLIDEDVPF
jgi:alkylation response protein AidB-like acyl-CoA dehydrogenase